MQLGINVRPAIANLLLRFNPFKRHLIINLDKNDVLDLDSDFHRIMRKHHKEILNLTIDKKKCSHIAEILHRIYVKSGKNIFTELYFTYNLLPEEICRVVYFSYSQNLYGSKVLEYFLKLHFNDPGIFHTKWIEDDPIEFLENIGFTSFFQIEKRIKYAKTAARTLIEKNLEPYDLFEYFGKDLLKMREFLLSNKDSGFDIKTTSMFIRDMVLLEVWKNPLNFDKIDVASDVNTVRVALRTGILQTAIPLVSSFLDIFCYQYTLIDEMNAMAWRKVWEIWQEKYPADKIESPCLIDYLVYRIIGKEFCKEKLCEFKCEEENHNFMWHSALNKTCQICLKKGKRNRAVVIRKILPCSDTSGNIVIENNEFVSGRNPILPNLKVCPFEPVCNPQNPSFIKFNPPKSISILGQTGWESARVNRDEGGGGLMS